jgi:hypothetical protein
VDIHRRDAITLEILRLNRIHHRMTVLYIDEAGEEGFGSTSSEWFILGGAFHRTGYAPTIKNHYEEYRRRHARDPSWYFHFRKASHDQKRGFIRHMLALDYVLVVVAIHKRSLKKTERFRQKYWLYHYAMKYLLEAVTGWMAANEPGRLTLIFSRRRGLDLLEFRSYLKRVRSSSHISVDGMTWKQLDDARIHTAENRRFVGLQMADCIASATFEALEINAYGMTECCYVRELGCRLLRADGSPQGLGVRIWPMPPQDVYSHSRFNWFREVR